MMAVISTKSPRKQDTGGDKAPLTPLAETKALAKALLEFHPLAAKFPLTVGKEFDELVKDVGTNGLIQPIIVHDGKILDGRNRYRACLESKVKPIFEPFSGNDPLAFVISANIHRRHLTPKLKRKIIADLIKADPSKSDRQIGKLIGADGKTIASIRAEQESRAEIPHVETRTDTKGRQQPGSKKPKSAVPPATDRRAEHTIKNGEPTTAKTPAGGRTSTSSAIAIAKRLVVELIAHGTKVDPQEIAKSVLRDGLSAETISKISRWLHELAAALKVDEAAAS